MIARDRRVIDARPRRRLDNRAVQVDAALNRRELQRYLSRVGDRWPIEAALLGGARVADQRGALPQRERGPEYVLVLVSRAFDGMPWLERVYQAARCGTRWRWASPADVHCYTPAEFERKRESMPAVRAVVAARHAALRGPRGRRRRRRRRRLEPARRSPPSARSAPGPARRSRPATLTSCTPSRSASRSLGSVIIFMKRQCAASLAAMKSTSGAACRSGWSIPVSVATIAVRCPPAACCSRA